MCLLERMSLNLCRSGTLIAAVVSKPNTNDHLRSVSHTVTWQKGRIFEIRIVPGFPSSQTQQTGVGRQITNLHGALEAKEPPVCPHPTLIHPVRGAALRRALTTHAPSIFRDNAQPAWSWGLGLSHTVWLMFEKVTSKTSAPCQPALRRPPGQNPGLSDSKTQPA